LPPQNEANGKSARQKPNGGSSRISLDDRSAKFLSEIPEGSEKNIRADPRRDWRCIGLRLRNQINADTA
jgi:hypothetical protein